MTQTITEPDDHDLLAYVDGRLTPDEAAKVEARLARDPEAAAAVQAFIEQNELIRSAADTLEPQAADLRTAALERKLADRLSGRRWAMPVWLRQTAAAVVLVCAGWFAHGQFQFIGGGDQLPGYVAEAIGAHGVFGEDRFRPVEFPAEASETVVQWASTKLGHEVRIPTLDALGLELIGSRLLGTAEGPLLYLIYEDAFANRLSVFVAPHPPEQPEYKFRLASVSDTTVGYWSDGALDYALVAATSDVQITAIADEIVAALAGM